MFGQHLASNARNELSGLRFKAQRVRRRVYDETEGSRMQGALSARWRKRKEGGRRHRPCHVVNDLFGRTRTRIVVRGGMRGIARVHLPESYFPPVHYRTVRAARYVRATAIAAEHACLLYK